MIAPFFLVWIALQMSPADLLPRAEPTSQPTTQVTLIIPTTDLNARPDTLLDAVTRSRFGQLVEGKKAITWNDVKSFGFWIDTIRDFAITIAAFIPRFIGTMIFLFVFWLIYRAIRRMAVGSMKKSNVDSSIRDMLSTLIKWCVMGFGIVIACNQLGIPIVAMLTGVSIIGLAVGFAAQETLANFIAGIVVFLDKPFKIGDWITVDNTYGQAKRVSFRSTRLLTLDGEVIVIPNTQVLSKQLCNHSTNPINRVAISVGIAYKESIGEARKVLLALTKDDHRIERSPAPEVIVKDLGDSSVNLALRFWIADEAVEKRITYEYNERAKNALDAANISIPFPHMQLFVEKSEGIDSLKNTRPAA